jgi:hypothetical protein
MTATSVSFSGHVTAKVAWEVDYLRPRRWHRCLVRIPLDPKARADPKGRHRDRQCCIDAEGEDHVMLRTLNKLLQQRAEQLPALPRIYANA